MGPHITEPPHRQAPWVSPLSSPEQWKDQDLFHQRLSSGFPSTSSSESSTHQQVKPRCGEGEAKRRSRVPRRQSKVPYPGTVAISCTAPIDTA